MPGMIQSPANLFHGGGPEAGTSPRIWRPSCPEESEGRVDAP